MTNTSRHEQQQLLASYVSEQPFGSWFICLCINEVSVAVIKYIQ